MKVRHKKTGKVYDMGFIYVRTNMDILEEIDSEKYNRIEDNGIQRTVFYIEEPLSDFEILENDNDNT